MGKCLAVLAVSVFGFVSAYTGCAVMEVVTIVTERNIDITQPVFTNVADTLPVSASHRSKVQGSFWLFQNAEPFGVCVFSML